jgi:hypothetical protein
VKIGIKLYFAAFYEEFLFSLTTVFGVNPLSETVRVLTVRRLLDFGSHFSSMG